MASRIFAACVVAFWVAMMAALVRVEYFPKPMPMDAIPAEQVMRRIFESPEQRLNVFYQGEDIGTCMVEVNPVLIRPAAGTNELAAAQPQKFYQVKSSVHLNLSMLNLPAHLRMAGNTQFNSRYEMQSFSIRATLGDGRIDLEGDDHSHKVKVQVDMGDVHEKREFDFNQIKGDGLANALGLPGLSNLGLLGGGLSGSRRTGGGLLAGDFRPRTTTSLAEFNYGGIVQRAYLLESKLDDRLSVKMWVDMSGAILRVETPVGLEMMAHTIIVPKSSSPRQPNRKTALKEKLPAHDPN